MERTAMSVRNIMFDQHLHESRSGDTELEDVYEAGDNNFLLKFKDHSLFLVEVTKIR